jgi:hypothetical protein
MNVVMHSLWFSTKLTDRPLTRTRNVCSCYVLCAVYLTVLPSVILGKCQ